MTRRRVLLAAILLLAALLRVGQWMEIRNGPIPEFHRWSDSDMNFYRGWAKAIAGGDWLTRQPMIPYHRWHADIARAALETPQLSFEEGKALWHVWLRPPRFYQDALYPYLLAAVFASFGERIHLVFLIQSVIGLANVLLVYAITRRLFDAQHALVAALMAATFGPAIYFEVLLLRTTLLTCLGLAVILVTAIACDKPGLRWWFASGALCGLSFLLKATGAGFLAIVVAAIVHVHRRDSFQRVFAALLGIGVMLVPLLVRNAMTGTAPLSLPSSGKPSFVRHNVHTVAAQTQEEAAAGVLLESNRTGTSASLITLRTHPSFASVAGHFMRRVAAVFNWFENPDNGNYYYFHLLYGGTTVVRIEYWVIASLAIPGIVMSFSRSPLHAVLLAYIALGIATMVVWHYVSRFRVPVAFALMPFAAFAVVDLARSLAAGRWIRFAAAAAATLLGAAILLRDAGQPRVRWQDYVAGNDIQRFVAARRAIAGDVAGARAAVESHLLSEPADLQMLSPETAGGSISRTSARSAASFAALHALAAELWARDDLNRSRHHHFRARVLAYAAAQYSRASGFSVR